jgi:hypothetical protein
MMCILVHTQIKAIATDFDRYPESSCSQPEFVEVMLRHLRLTQLHTTPLMLVWCLNELFDSMDLDGDKSLEFDEFLATVVHMGMGGSDQMVLDPAKTYDEGKRFRSHSKFNVEQLVQYVPSIDAVLVLEPESSLSLCDATTMAPVRTLPLTHALMAGRSACVCVCARVAQCKCTYMHLHPFIIITLYSTLCVCMPLVYQLRFSLFCSSTRLRRKRSAWPSWRWTTATHKPNARLVSSSPRGRG